jgi:hypothetical protein
MAESNGTRSSLSPGIFMRLMADLTSRIGASHRLGSTHGGAREIEDVLGYKDRLTYADFKRAYLRYDLAQALVNTYPEATWGQPPTLKDADDADNDTPFMAGWQSLLERIDIFRYLAQADLLANLGSYAVVVIGLRNQPLLNVEATPVRSPDDVLWVQAHSQEVMTIDTFGTDASQPTYRRPTMYRLATGGVSEHVDREPPRLGTQVHASRTIHVPGALRLDEDIYGLPVLEAVYNKLVDLLKVVGGSAEMFWKDAKRRIALEVQEGYQLSEADAAVLQTEAEEYAHGLRDFLRLMGVQAKDLSGVVASPKEHFEVLMQSIAGTTRIPMRKLLGSEVGQLASTQDESAFLQQVGRRQVKYAEPDLVRALVNRLVTLGALPAPLQRFTCDWGNIWALSELQQAVVTKDRATAINQTMSAIAQYRGPGLGDTVITTEELRALLGTVWQSSELELPVELPPEIVEQEALDAELQALEPMPATPEELTAAMAKWRELYTRPEVDERR